VLLKHRAFIIGIKASRFRTRSGAAGLASEIEAMEMVSLRREDHGYDEDGLRLAATLPFPTPEQAFAEARKVVDTARHTF
jgi:hypothetical protein